MIFQPNVPLSFIKIVIKILDLNSECMHKSLSPLMLSWNYYIYWLEHEYRHFYDDIMLNDMRNPDYHAFKTSLDGWTSSNIFFLIFLINSR